MQQDLISTSREFLLDTKYPSVAATREAFRRQEGACRAFHEALGVQEGARGCTTHAFDESRDIASAGWHVQIDGERGRAVKMILARARARSNVNYVYN